MTRTMFCVLLLAVAFTWLAYDSSQAMDRCLERFSEATCIYTLK